MGYRGLDFKRSQKRILDALLVIALAPIALMLGATTALAVAITMGRPVIFKQQRIGLHERPFNLLKFRTMTTALDSQGQLLPDHERLTRTGKVLRKLSLDELPQLLNVLRGEMSIVGPRPLLPEYLPYYRGRERTRHHVRPGITGLAQTSGRNALTWDARLAMDADYVDRVGLRQDLRIMGATLAQVVRGTGVSEVANDSGERLDTLRGYPAEDGYAVRRFEFKDIDTRVRLFRDPRIRKYMSLPEGVTSQTTEEWLRLSRRLNGRKDFVVCHMETGEVIGLLGLRDRATPGVPEMYILIDPRHQGQGLGALSLSLLLTWMKREKGYRGCWLSVHKHNSAAVALYQRAGFSITNDVADQDRLEMEIVWKDNHEHARSCSA